MIDDKLNFNLHIDRIYLTLQCIILKMVKHTLKVVQLMLGHLGTLCIKEYCTHKAEKVFGFRGKKGFNFCKNFRDKQL